MEGCGIGLTGGGASFKADLAPCREQFLFPFRLCDKNGAFGNKVGPMLIGASAWLCGVSTSTLLHGRPTEGKRVVAFQCEG